MFPDGHSDVLSGKIAAVVTHLQMMQPPPARPAPDGAWGFRRVEHPPLDWYRDLYRRIGEEWLWFARLPMSDAALTACVQAPGIEVYALVHDGRDEGLAELDFRVGGECGLVYFGVQRAA